MNNKKPTLSEFGLTQREVDYNEYAKKNRQKIIRENEKIDEDAAHYGWTVFGISLPILLIICAITNTADLFVVFGIIAAAAGGLTCAVIKSRKTEVPIYRKDIEDKYQKYLKAVADYELYKSLNKTSAVKTPTKETTKSTTANSKIENKSQLNSTTTSTRTIAQPDKAKVNSVENYQIGTIIRHPHFGIGKIVNINNDKSIIDVEFEKDLSYKKFVTNIVKFEIVETSNSKINKKITELVKPIEKPKTAPVEKINQTPKTNEAPSITYENSKIGLTKSQEEIFNQMLDISLKFCMDLQIEDRKHLLGVGLTNQEKLRYYLHKKDNEIYVKFADNTEHIILDNENKNLLFEMTKDVNNKFESNPEKYQLAKYKEEQKVKEKQIIQEETTDDIFDVDEDTSEVGIKEHSNTLNDIVFDKSTFSIHNTKLIKCYNKKSKNSYDIPNGVTEIADNAFAEHSSLYNLTIPESVTKIGNNAFKDCKNLKDLILPGSIKEIGSNAFEGCENLETIFCNTKAVKKLLINLPKHIEIVCLEF